MTTTTETFKQDPLVAAAVPDEVIDQVMAGVDSGGLQLLGPDGVLAELTKRLLDRAMDEELTDHLGYERGDAGGRRSGNNRNGTSAKTVLTEVGAVDLAVPRDRNGTFEPKIVPKHARRLDGFNANIVHLYARGMSTRDIRRELARMYGIEVSPELISRVTDGIVDELNEWQARPLDAVYPIMYIDALVVKVRTNGTVVNRAAYLGVGVDVEGRKHVLGVWLGDGGEGAKFWLSVLTELRNRGVNDVLLVCCDGLKGLPDAIEATWPQALVQTCVIHLIRASIRFCSWKDRKAITAALRPIYAAPTVEAADDAMDTFELEWGDRYPGIVKVWRNSWEQFTPFLRFPPELRKIVYTTNLVESINYQLRKVTKTRGHFPTDAAALKLLRLAARNISDKRGGDLGTGTWGWSQALNAFEIHFPGRLGLTNH
jgi:transposase-like protein